MNIQSSKTRVESNLPKIKCPNHSNQIVNFINLDKNQRSQLVCNSCIVEFKLNSEKLVQLQSIFYDVKDENNSQFITNLTPIIPSSEQQDLIIENEVVQLKQIIEWFNEFKMRINNIIDQNLKQSLDNIQQLNQHKKNIINMYNNLSKKTEIKSLIEKYSSNRFDSEKQLKILIQEKNNSSDKDIKIIQDLLQEFKEQKIKLDINPIRKQLDSCEEIFKQDVKKRKIKQIRSYDTIINTQNLSNEIFLDLQVNQDTKNINNKQSQILADKLGECINLQYLNLYLHNSGGFSDITSKGCIYLADGIKKCQQLQYLSLSIGNNNIKDEGVIELCKGISQNQQLLELKLYLSSNNIYDKGVYAVADLIKQCKNITHLNLGFYWNYITDNGVLRIIETFKLFKQLFITISFRENKIKNKEQLQNEIYSLNSIIIQNLQF